MLEVVRYLYSSSSGICAYQGSAESTLILFTSPNTACQQLTFVKWLDKYIENMYVPWCQIETGYTPGYLKVLHYVHHLYIVCNHIHYYCYKYIENMYVPWCQIETGYTPGYLKVLHYVHHLYIVCNHIHYYCYY